MKTKPQNKTERSSKSKKNFSQTNSKTRCNDYRLSEPVQEWEWYAPSEEVAKDMASIAFNKSIGEPVGVPQSIDETNPGLVCFGYYPTIGFTSQNFGNYSTNYQTRAANAYYQYITQGFTSLNTLEAPDLFMTGVAASNLIAAMMNFKRAYGVMSYYLQLNPYFAKSIVETLGFNYESMLSNLANARTEYNLRVDAINKTIAVPSKFALLNRWIYVNSYLFTDSDAVDQCSMYAYTPLAVLRYDATGSTTGTCLRYVKLGDANNPKTVSQYFAIIDQLISSLTDEDVRDAFAAIRRVYNDSDFAKLTYLESDYKTPIAHTDIAALQMHNMVSAASTNVDWSVSGAGGFLPASFSATGSDEFDVAMYQTDKGIIRCEPFVTIIGSISDPTFVNPDDPINGMLGGKAVIDCYESKGDPKDILDLTANIQFLDGKGWRAGVTGTSVEYPVVVRSENVFSIYAVYNLAATGQTVKYKLYQYYTNKYGLGMSTSQASIIPYLGRTLNVLTRLDSHPLIYTSFITDESSPFPSTIIGELDKYTTVSEEFLAELHNRCMYQMTLLPANTKSITK